MSASNSKSEVVDKVNAANSGAAQPEFNLRAFAKSVLEGLGSLRLTVFLLTLGLLLVLIATLQQTTHGIFKVKDMHFSEPMVFVPFQEVLIPAWFPNLQNVGGGFLMPSGSAVLFAMLLNLFCAHLLRFRVQAKGGRLVGGLIGLAIGTAVTFGVIAYGNSRGFQESPLIEWKTQWEVLKWLLFAGGAAGIAGALTLGSSVRRVFSLIGGILAIVLGVLVLMLGDNGYIGDDAMRVVWRLAQGLIAATICYVGAYFVFKRKAGIVLIHAGLLLLMVGELYTTYSAVEQRMGFYEGETAEHTINVDKVELAFITKGEEAGKQDVVVIPSEHLELMEPIDVDQLPFIVQPVAYFRNSDWSQMTREEAAKSTGKGMARFLKIDPIPEVPGTDMDSSNFAGGYIKLIDKETKADLGTFMLSQYFYRRIDLELDRIKVKDTEYQIGLRYQHFYKPYKIELLSTTREDYTGTNLPQSYSSRFRITDASTGLDEIKSVHMNRPLRYSNETFYQSGHNVDPNTGKKQSVFQIVENTGWMIPYVSCGMVGLGLLLHFLSIFVRFVEKLIVTRPKKTQYDRVSWVCVIGLVLIFAMWGYRKIEKPAVSSFATDAAAEVNLKEFSKLPVAFGGRVQPLDSTARSTLRKLRKYEIPVKYDMKLKTEVEYSPSQWLADWIFQAPGCEDYRIFKVENPDIISTLRLIRRKSHLFSYAELTFEKEAMEKAVADARRIGSRNEALLTVYQKRIIKLDDNLSLVRGLRDAFTGPDGFEMEDPFAKLNLLMRMEQGVNLPQSTPLAEKGKWEVASLLMAPSWIEKLTEQYSTKKPLELAKQILGVRAQKQIMDSLTREELMRGLLSLGPEFRKFSQAQLNDFIDRFMDENRTKSSDPSAAMMEDILDRMRTEAEARVAVDARNQWQQMSGTVARALESFADVKDGEFDFSGTAELPPIAAMKQAYLAGDNEAFQAAVQKHMESVGDKEDVADNKVRVGMEEYYNRFSPMYLSITFYIVSLLIAFLSWLLLVGSSSSQKMLSWSNGLRRGAFWLLVLAVTIHTIGLVMRIYISGRPPVTNLYSSAVFIGLVAAVLGIVSERIIGYSFGTVLGSLKGAVCLYASFSLGADGDTMSVLQAVLDTQFWLSTHVVTITIGYAATFGAGFLGIVYLCMSMFVPVNLKENRKVLGKMVYGVTCLALLFSFVGTVLGGLWGDDSWGRFWGWDPKENGALMIVLINAILLHARWAGLVKDRGMACIAIIGNVVTLWSWFAVNELGVGLHTYGFTEGRMVLIGQLWAAHIGLVVLACLPSKWWLGNRAIERDA